MSTWWPRTPSRLTEPPTRPVLEVRPERALDHDAISEITKAAFAGHPGAGEPESALISALRRSGALTLSLVAVEQERLIGHAAVSPVSIDGVERWFGLAPVSVRPERQRRGIGRALIQAGLARLGDQRANGCVVLGEPDYYRRFGFRFDGSLSYPPAPSDHLGQLTFNGPAPRGLVRYHPAFDGV